MKRHHEAHAKTDRKHYSNEVDIIENDEQLNKSMDDVDLDDDEEDKQMQSPLCDDEYDDEIDSGYFEQLNTSRRQQLNRTSNVSMNSAGSQLTEIDELKQKSLHINSLTSIVNNPKKDSFMKKLKKVVKNNIQGKKHMHRSANKKYTYKHLTEKDIPDSYHIPKV